MGDKPGPIVITGAPSDSGGSSGSSDSSSSSSSSGSSAPAVDPVVARKVALFQSIYMSLWGEPATENYLKGFKDMNSYEFALNERMKPAWLQTKAFKDQFANGSDLFKQIGIGS